jgi:hypothetical protein
LRTRSSISIGSPNGRLTEHVGELDSENDAIEANATHVNLTTGKKILIECLRLASSYRHVVLYLLGIRGFVCAPNSGSDWRIKDGLPRVPLEHVKRRLGLKGGKYLWVAE